MDGRHIAILAAACALVGAAPAAAAEPVFETYSVPTVNGASISVEVMRPAGDAPVPVILTYSPYNTLSETNSPNLANDRLGERFVPRGYARAVADVLGTRNSSGCWDYGGADEQQSGVDLVNFLAGRPWSSGKVAMIGGSYDGTTANMVAARGAEVPGLAAIVPQAAISRWYGYAYGNGVRYFLNSEEPTDEGFDTPLAFDFGLVRTPPTDPAAAPAMVDRADLCEAAEHTARGYDDTPDYDDFWLERDYLKDAAGFRAAVLVAHGWQDYNVKPSEGVGLYEALPDDGPLKFLYAFQGPHASPSGREGFDELLDRFFDHTLLGVANGLEGEPRVLTEGRSAAGPTALRAEADWPPPGTAPLEVELASLPVGTVPASYRDSGLAAEERSRLDPEAESEWLYYATAPMPVATRLAGRAELELELRVDRDHGQLTPVLVDVAPDGTATTISRGFLDLRYRDGLGAAVPLPVGERFAATVRFEPQDQTVEPGHRIGVLVQSSNAAWAVSGEPGLGVELLGGALVLPVAGG